MMQYCLSSPSAWVSVATNIVASRAITNQLIARIDDIVSWTTWTSARPIAGIAETTPLKIGWTTFLSIQETARNGCAVNKGMLTLSQMLWLVSVTHARSSFVMPFFLLIFLKGQIGAERKPGTYMNTQHKVNKYVCMCMYGALDM